MLEHLPEVKDVTRNSLSADQVEYMERALTRHYGCRVTSVEKYCDGFRTWHSAIQDKVARLHDPDASEVHLDRKWYDSDEAWQKSLDFQREQELKLWQGVLDALAVLYLPIVKSCLLNRLIYMGEPLRSRMCPVHRGHWVGYAMGGDQCECSLGSADITGWLPEGPLSLDQKIALYTRDKGLPRAEYWYETPAASGYVKGKPALAKAAWREVRAATMEEAVEELAKQLKPQGFDPSKY